MPWPLHSRSHVTRYKLHTHRMAERVSKGLGQIVGRNPRRPLQLHYPFTSPVLLDEFRSDPTNIFGGDHGKRFVCRREETADHSFVANRGYIPHRPMPVPSRIAHEDANGLSHLKQCARLCAAHFAGNFCDGVRVYLLSALELVNLDCWIYNLNGGSIDSSSDAHDCVHTISPYIQMLFAMRG
jgi:hypothetical protein